MADGEVKIKVDAEDSGVEKKLDDISDSAEETAGKLEDVGKSGGNAAKGLKDVEENADKAGKKFKFLGKETDASSLAMSVLEHATGNLLSGGIEGLISGIGDAITSLLSLADETREFRDDMAKLQTAFSDAGHDTESASKAYEDFYAILGESDRSVEAVNHLAELTDNTEELSKWSTIAAGVTAKFGDSLPIEGLTEAANETAKVGQVTGPLADALNWAGISEDKFNEALKKCNSEQERATLITNTLNTEYAEAAAEYNTLTASTQEARRATAEMEAQQARLGAAIEPVTTAWTNLKATALSWLADVATGMLESNNNLTTSTGLLTEKQREQILVTSEVAQSYRDTKAAAAELAGQQLADVDYATNTLLPQLQALVDSNGNVKKGYEERAAFIMGQLNEAYGTEYTRISEIVGKNGELTQSIQEAIAAKQAQILLEEHEGTYAEAIRNKTEAEQSYLNLMREVASQAEAVANKEKELEALRAEQDAAFTARNNAKGQEIKRKADLLEASLNAEKSGLDNLKKRYDDAKTDYEGYVNDITNYETAKGLILQGKTEEAVGYLNNLNAGYISTGSAAEDATEAEKKALEDRLINAATKLQLLKEEHAKNYKSMTDEQKAQIDARIKQAEQEVEKLIPEAEKMGSNLVEGIGTGADGKKDWLSTKLGGIVTAGIEAAKKAGIIKSPSRKMKKEVGHELINGAVLGVEEKQKSFMNSMKNVVGGAVEEAKKGAEATVKALEEAGEKAEKALEDQIEALSEKRTTANAKQIDAQKKALQKELKLLKEKNKEELEIAKEREKANSDFAKEYEKYLSEIEKLEEDYAKNSAKIQEKLAQDIDNAVKDYQTAFANRVQSIKSGLSLFEKAEKGNAVRKSDLTKALTSQIDVLEAYNGTIDELSTRLEGDTGKENFLAEMLGLGVDYLPELQAINRMTDEELDKYVELWKQKNRLAVDAATTEFAEARQELDNEIASLEEQAAKDAETLKTEYNKALIELTSEVGANMAAVGEAGLEELGKQLVDYAATGEELMNSIAEGIESGESSVINAAADVVRKAIEKAQEAAGIKARLQATVSAENAKYGATSRSADTELASEIVSAVGTQSAGINSLAGAIGKTAGAATQTVIIELDKRELGRAVVAVGNAENARVGSKISVGGAK